VYPFLPCTRLSFLPQGKVDLLISELDEA